MNNAIRRVLYEVCLQVSPENDNLEIEQEEEPSESNIFTDFEDTKAEDKDVDHSDSESVKNQLFNNCVISHENAEKNEFDFFEDGIQNHSDQ